MREIDSLGVVDAGATGHGIARMAAQAGLEAVLPSRVDGRSPGRGVGYGAGTRGEHGRPSFRPGRGRF